MRDFVYIIAEFNPPHNGHAYLVGEARRRFPDASIIAIMSGHFTQRGSPAVTDKFTRARAAVAVGCDLVLSLPFPFSSSSAENFAVGGVAVASAIAAAFPSERHTLVFGSECGSTPALCEAARRISGEGYRSALYSAANGGHNARDMRAVYASLYGEDEARILDGANDALGIEYIRAISYIGANIAPAAVRRVGAAHDGDPIGSTSSASYIRALLSQNDSIAWTYVPASVRDIISSSAHGTVSEKRVGAAIHAILRMTDPETADGFYECGGGVGRRLVRAASLSGDYDSMMSLAATKQYTNARLRRAALMAAAGIDKKDIAPTPLFTQLLAANDVGTAILHCCRGDLPILTKPADIEKLPERAREQAALDARADALFTLGFNPPLPAGSFTKSTPYIEKGI